MTNQRTAPADARHLHERSRAPAELPTPAVNGLRRPRGSEGLTLIELLIVLAIIGIAAAMAFTNGRGIVQSQQERAALGSLQRTIWQGATGAAARGEVLELDRDGRTMSLRVADTGRVVRTVELPGDGDTTFPEGVSLRFMPPGKVDPATILALPDPLTITADDTTYDIAISLIGETRFEEAP
jgi:prepilin-type N-terminal cleavage/methylation domain-containing protein